MRAAEAAAAASDEEPAPPPPLVAGVARALSPLVRRIVAPNPGKMTGPGTNTYLVGIDEIAVIDPGPDDASHLEAVTGCGGDRIRWILCTHTHPDHAPGAAALKEATGAEVLAFGNRDGLKVDKRIGQGHKVEATEFRLTAHHTPGPRLEPPLLLPRGGAHALLGRPHHAGLHRRDQPARRRHGGLPRLAGQGPPAPAEVDRPGSRSPDRRPQAAGRLVHRAPPRARAAGARRADGRRHREDRRARRRRSTSTSTPSWSRSPSARCTPTC